MVEELGAPEITERLPKPLESEDLESLSGLLKKAKFKNTPEHRASSTEMIISLHVPDGAFDAFVSAT